MKATKNGFKNLKYTLKGVPKLVIVASIFIVAGIIILIRSHAATPFVASEVETGTIVAPAAKVTDTTASGSAAVNFASGSQSTSCTNPQYTTSATDGGISLGGYYVHNNMWNATTGETMYVCDYNNWYVDATSYTGTSVKTYPNVHLDFPNAFTTGVPFSTYSTLTTKFAGHGPGFGIYDVAYDLWLNGVGNGNGSTEVMVWTENLSQAPLGTIKSQYTAGGVTYDVWDYHVNGINVVSYAARGTQYSGTVDLKALINDGINKGYIPANPSLRQFGYGIEFCSTNGTNNGVKARFTVTDFSITRL